MDKTELLGFYADGEMVYFHELRKLKKRVEKCKAISESVGKGVAEKSKDANVEAGANYILGKIEEVADYCETVINILEIAEIMGIDDLRG